MNGGLRLILFDAYVVAYTSSGLMTSPKTSVRNVSDLELEPGALDLLNCGG
jgi:hypothetical protein